MVPRDNYIFRISCNVNNLKERTTVSMSLLLRKYRKRLLFIIILNALQYFYSRYFNLHLFSKIFSYRRRTLQLLFTTLGNRSNGKWDLMKRGEDCSFANFMLFNLLSSSMFCAANSTFSFIAVNLERTLINIIERSSLIREVTINLVYNMNTKTKNSSR